jgi:23S rRNA (pseudouridine1915-N3)-methyltransferase
VRIRVIGEGKPKDAHLRALEADYEKRISRFTDLKVEEVRQRDGARPPSAALTATERRLLDRLKGSYKVLLDARGHEWSSAEFAEWLGERALRGTKEVVFLVGGPDGFSAAFREQADLLFALSRLTFTHDWARTLLLEQIYRGFTILRGYPYAR